MRHCDVIISQLKSNVAVLNSFFLYMVKLAGSLHCVYCGKIETIQHYLFDCPRYDLSKLGLNEENVNFIARLWF